MLIACLFVAVLVAACSKENGSGGWVTAKEGAVGMAGAPAGPAPKPALDITAPAPRMEGVRPYKSGAELTAACHTTIDDVRARLAGLEGFSATPTIDSVYKPYNEMSLELADAWQETDLLQQVHPSKDIRDAADQCDQAFSKVSTDISLSRPLYDLIVKIDQSGADAPTKYSLFKTLRDFRRAGVDKDEATRQKIRELTDEETKAAEDFSRVIRDDVRHIEIASVNGLAGLPQDYIDAHKPGPDGKILITTNDADFIPFITYAKDDAERKALDSAYRDVGDPENDNNLRRLLQTRYQLARLLGYPDYASYALEPLMAQSPDKAQAFIEQIGAIVKPAVARDMKVLLAQLHRTDPKAKEVQDWQKIYLGELVREQKYAVDSRKLRTYFPFDQVEAGVLKLAEDQFGLSIKPWNTPVWDPHVTAYEIYEGDKLIGRFYLDLHPRDGKYQSAAQFPIATGIEGEQIPIGALVCNFPGGDDPHALMEHDDVVTFFHEFGHLLHHILGGHVAWVNNSGVATENDFVEAPSQLRENWAYDYDVLKRFAVNAKGQTIPEALVKQLDRARHFGLGIETAQQIFYASLSLDFYRHDPASLDLVSELKDLQSRYSPFPYIEGTRFYDGFGHLNEYSAFYYTYQWSLAIAQDMFTRFEKEGLMDPKVNSDYRKLVLDPGGSAPAAELVQNFLGRPWSTDAYRDWLNRTE